jgi:hypothetical protein
MWTNLHLQYFLPPPEKEKEKEKGIVLELSSDMRLKVLKLKIQNNTSSRIDKFGTKTGIPMQIHAAPIVLSFKTICGAK